MTGAIITAILISVITAVVIAVYKLGYYNGQIKALQWAEEVTKNELLANDDGRSAGAGKTSEA